MKTKKPTKKLFKHLDDVLAVADKKFSMNNKNDKDRLYWGRLIVQAVGQYGKLLELETPAVGTPDKPFVVEMWRPHHAKPED